MLFLIDYRDIDQLLKNFQENVHYFFMRFFLLIVNLVKFLLQKDVVENEEKLPEIIDYLMIDYFSIMLLNSTLHIISIFSHRQIVLFRLLFLVI